MLRPSPVRLVRLVAVTSVLALVACRTAEPRDGALGPSAERETGSTPTSSSAPETRERARARNLLADREVRHAVLRDAAREDDAATVRSLVRYGVDVDEDLGGGKTALTLAAYHRSSEAVSALLEANARPNGPSEGISPLAHAAFVGDDEIVRALLRAGAEVDRPTSFGQTPLMFAALFGRESTYALLVAEGASETRRDAVGNTARSLRAHARDGAAVEGFLRHASSEVLAFAKGSLGAPPASARP